MKEWTEKNKEKERKEKADEDARRARLPEVAKLLGVSTSMAEQMAPFHRLQAQRSIGVDVGPWARPQVFWNQSWKSVCEASKIQGESSSKTLFYCGSQACKKKFGDETSFWQHLNSKAGSAGHPSKEICKRWSKDQPYVPVKDEDHPTPEELQQKKKEQKEKMHAAISAANEAVAAMVKRAHGTGEEESSTSDDSESTQAGEEGGVDVIKEAAKFGLTVEELPPDSGSAGKEEFLEVPDKEALHALFKAKAEERKSKGSGDQDKEVPVEESTESLSEKAKARRAGMSAFGIRMLSCALDQVIEEIPGEMKGLEELAKSSPTSPAEAAEAPNASAEESAEVPAGGVMLSAVTEHPSSTPDKPGVTPSSHEMTCRACQGTGKTNADMNAAIAILLEAQVKANAQADQEQIATVSSQVKKEDASPADGSLKRDKDQEDDKRQGEDFSVDFGESTSDFVVIELCCNEWSQIRQATRRLHSMYLGVHSNLKSSKVRQALVRTLVGAGKKKIYMHTSLPCTGGSPLLNFAKEGIRDQHRAKFLTLLDSLSGYFHAVKRVDPKVLITFELPHQNQYWQLDLVRSFREKWQLLHHGVVAGCRTGLCSSQGRPIGKRYRIVSGSQELALHVHRRFSECQCKENEHAAFNQIDWHETERYTKTFATFLVRTAFRVRESLG